MLCSDKKGKKMSHQTKHSLMLTVCAFIWGTTFVAQSVVTDSMGAFTYNFSRSVIACIFISFVIRVFDKKKIVTHPPKNSSERFYNIKGGIVCGTILTFGMFFQQYGLGFTTVEKAGFLTTLYIILVPIVGIFMGKKSSFFIWISVALTIVGLYLLCISETLHLAKGDLLMIISAIIYTLQILAIDHYSPNVDGVRMSFYQFMVVGIESFILMMIFDNPQLSQITDNIIPILYAGILSSGIAYTLQILGQANLNPAIASVIMSLESVFSALSGWLVLHEKMTVKEFMGCALIFTAVLLAQIKPKEKVSV
ncbi:MAG: DMT family transporter [Eubacterium sp.]|nr:DMT family transporter [Eubacterium sp.]